MSLEKYTAKENLKQTNDKYNRIREKYKNNIEELERQKKLQIRYLGDLKHPEINAKEENDKLYSGVVNSQREYQKIESSINSLKNSIDEKENELLEVIDTIDKIEKETKEHKIKLIRLRNHFEHQKENHNKDIEAIQKTISELEKNIESLSAMIEDSIMDKYNRVKAKKYLAMAGLLHNTCTGCNVDVSTATIQNIKLSKSLVTCDNCGRILYAKV